MKCIKCGSNNINIQIVNESYLKNDPHGCLWWIIIGWWLIPIKWIFFTIPAIIFKLFGIGKRKKIINVTKKKAVCQNCGYITNI